MNDCIVLADADRADTYPYACHAPPLRQRPPGACALAGAAAVILALMAGPAHATTVSAGQVDTVDATSPPFDDQDTVLSGGIQNVNSGGTAVGTMVSSGGIQNVNNGGAAVFGFTIDTGVQNVSSGGTGDSVTVSSGGIQNVFSGATVHFTQVGSGGLLNIVGGFSFSSLIQSGGTQVIFSGGSALSPHIFGEQIVSSGGSAKFAFVHENGLQEVLSGGIATEGEVSGANARQTVDSGGTAISISLVGSGAQIVSAGAVISAVEILSGGSQLINSGASVVLTDQMSGGSQTVLSGGTVIQSVVNSGAVQVIEGGGVGIATTILFGATQSLAAGALASSAAIFGGGVQLIGSGASAVATMLLSGGSQDVPAGATAVQTLINSGTVQSVDSGGIAISAIVSSAGTQAVASGAHVSNTLLFGGAAQRINSGASVVATTLVSGGNQNVPNGATAIQTLINPGTVQTVAGGGLAVAATILSAGTQAVAAGASAIGTTLGAGGLQAIASGGVVTDTHVRDGGNQDVPNGAAAIHTDLAGGSVQTVNGGGIASNTEIDFGGLQVILAAALVSGTLINVGGSALARDTGVSLSNLILNGGTLALSDITTGPVQPVSFNQVTVHGLSGSGTVTFATEFTAGAGDQLNLQNGHGALGLSVLDYSTTDPDPAARLLLVTTDSATTTQVALNGRYVDVGAFQYGVLKDGTQYFLAARTLEPESPDSGAGAGAGAANPADSADHGIGGTNGRIPTDTTQTVVAAAKAAGAIWYDQLQQVQKRLGDLRSTSGNDGAWVRGYGDERRLFNPGVKIDAGGVQAGFDHRLRTVSGDWIAGLTAGVGYDRLDMGASGTGNVSQWNVGLYGLWLSEPGWYVGATAKYNALGQHVNSMTGEGIPVSAAYHLGGYTVSVEGGRRFFFNAGWFVEPQLEWTLTHGGSAAYSTNTGLPVGISAATAQLARAGVSFGKKIALSGQDAVEPYMRLSAVRQYSGDNAVIVAGAPFDVTTRGTYGVVSIGATAQYRKQLQFYGEVGYARGSSYAMPWSVNAGLRYSW